MINGTANGKKAVIGSMMLEVGNMMLEENGINMTLALQMMKVRSPRTPGNAGETHGPILMRPTKKNTTKNMMKNQKAKHARHHGPAKNESLGRSGTRRRLLGTPSTRPTCGIRDANRRQSGSQSPRRGEAQEQAERKGRRQRQRQGPPA